MTVQGTVVAAYGRQYLVKLTDGRAVSCFVRGKRSTLACGDLVNVLLQTEGQGVVESFEPRQSLLYRSDAFRQKLIAANVTQLMLVVATEPSFSTELLTRCTVAAQNQDMRVVIVLNKCDLNAQVDAAKRQLAPFVKLGYPVLTLSAVQEITPLLAYLEGHRTVLVGQSGMGKSTIINGLIPGTDAATREISEALDSGKHTTTHARLYPLNEHSSVIDSPGLQEFGLGHLSQDDIFNAFVELKPLAGQCRFRNCRHDQEPDCAVHKALQSGEVDRDRYRVFLSLCNTVAKSTHY